MRLVALVALLLFPACVHRAPCMTGFEFHTDVGVSEYGDRYTGGGVTVYFDTTGACTADEWEEEDDPGSEG